MAAPYLVGTVNHAKKNKTAKITAAPYLAGKVNHAMKNKTAKITDSVIRTWMYYKMEIEKVTLQQPLHHDQ